MNNINGIDNDDFSMEIDPYLLFVNSIKSDETKRKYLQRLKTFFDFISIPPEGIDKRCNIFIQNCNNNPRYVSHCALNFIVFQKERIAKKEIVAGTLNNYLKPIRKLCALNDVKINWKRFTSGIPRERKYADDRAPTKEEIRRLLEYPDRRIKAIVLTMVSSGIRLGAWNYLQLKHIQPLEKYGKIVAAKVVIYAGTEDEYFSFINNDAYQAIQNWIDFRRKNNEQVSGENWIIRNLWDVTTPNGGKRGSALSPKKLKETGIKSLMQRALRVQGIRIKLEPGKKRYPFPTDHGFRKFFKTQCELAEMNSRNIAFLLDHSVGVEDSYHRPTVSQLLDDYIKAADTHLATEIL